MQDVDCIFYISLNNALEILLAALFVDSPQCMPSGEWALRVHMFDKSVAAISVRTTVLVLRRLPPDERPGAEGQTPS